MHRKVSREHVIEMAKLAGAHEFISKLPQGYDTMIEERGISLSGGQRQRIAIARALAGIRESSSWMRRPVRWTTRVKHSSNPISGNRARDRTVIIIAHRLSTVRSCDRIVGIADGRITKTGLMRNSCVAKMAFIAACGDSRAHRP